jgi:CelD/BcsL family acetyltransferase involved in cellulose biosynthesis
VVAVGDCIEHAVQRGRKRFDFLRGGEPYKYWWGAKDRRTMRLRMDRRVNANPRQHGRPAACESECEWSPAGLAAE